MPKNPELSRRKQERRQQEDYITNRILIVFFTAVVALVLLMLLNGSYNTVAMMALRVVLLVVASLSLAGVICGIFWTVRAKPRADGTRRAFGGSTLSVLCLFIGLSCLAIYLYGTTIISVLYVAIPVVAILYLVYYIYQREFFLLALLCALGGMGLWGLSRIFGSSYWGQWSVWFVVAAALLILLAALLVWRIKHNHGVIKLGKRCEEFLPKTAKYVMLFVTCGLLLLLVVGTLICSLAGGNFLASEFAYYAMFGVFGYLFIMAVYYTVKLM